MGTPLQDVYDSFIAKVDEDLTGKESLIFVYLKSAKAKCYKNVRHSLDYVLNANSTYDGNFNDTLDDDEILLLSLNMLYEHKRRRKEKIEALQREIGTKDFNNFPDKVRELAALRDSMKELKLDIDDLTQSFYTYKYD